MLPNGADRIYSTAVGVHNTFLIMAVLAVGAAFFMAMTIEKKHEPIESIN